MCAATASTKGQLLTPHNSLGHLGYARLKRFVRTRNLPYTSDELKTIYEHCAICAKIKPCFYHFAPKSLIKATRPWERLAVDFKGPVKGRRPYLLVLINDYSCDPIFDLVDLLPMKSDVR